MSHDIETSKTGKASFVSAREDAWHQLGTVLPDAFTAEDAMTHGYLGGWDIRKAETFARDPKTGLEIPIEGKYAILRNNPHEPSWDSIDVLGDSRTDSYTIIQNEEHAAFLNHLVDESGAVFETAGSLNGGRQVFLSMKLPGHIKVGGVDKVDMYIAAVNSHDGSLAFSLMITPIRVVCANTLNIALKTHDYKYKIRHTRNATTNLEQARRALDMTFEYYGDFQKQAERMINTELTQNQFEKIIDQEFGVPDDRPTAVVTRTENKLNQMAELFGDAYTHEGLRNTAWAGFNAVAEWADHFAPVRGNDRSERRATKSVLDPGFKHWAFEIFSEVR